MNIHAEIVVEFLFECDFLSFEVKFTDSYFGESLVL